MRYTYLESFFLQFFSEDIVDINEAYFHFRLHWEKYELILSLDSFTAMHYSTPMSILFSLRKNKTTVKRKPVIWSEIFIKVDEKVELMTRTDICNSVSDFLLIFYKLQFVMCKWWD